MKYFNYCCVRVVFWFLGILPWWLSRCIGYGLLFVLYDVLRLRRTVVENNIRLCFPETSARSSRRLARKSYLYMIETLIESARFMYYRERHIKQRITLRNTERVKEYLDAGCNVVFWVGHFANAEAHSMLAHYFDVPSCCAFKPTKNPYIDAWLKARRERFGGLMLSSKQVLSELTRADAEIYQSGKPVIIEMRADQRADPRRAFMLDFFGMQCAFFKGSELIARRMKMPMFYMRSKRIRPGHYAFELVELDAPANEWGARTQQAVKHLETEIRHCPEMYFWVHKRFKEVDLSAASRTSATLAQEKE